MGFVAHLQGGPRDGEQVTLRKFDLAFFVSDPEDETSAVGESPVPRKGMYAATRSAARIADQGGNEGDFEWQGWR
jgi:hypothetical protein